MHFQTAASIFLKDAVIYFATNGREGLDILLKVEKIDLVVTDYNMPIMDGRQMLQKFKSYRSDLPPTIFISGNPSLTLEALQDLGVIEVMMKPFLDEHFERSVTRVLLTNQ